MGRDTLTFEQVDDEIYIVVDGETVGRILDQGADNYYVILEGSDYKIPIHGLDSAKRYILKEFTKNY